MAEPRTTLVFRYDDYHASLGARSAEQDAIERRFLAAFAEAGVPLTVGVVPTWEERHSLAEDAEKLGALRALVAEGRAEPALHGLTHRSAAPAGARASEFAGLPQDRQAERLARGKALLEEWLGAPVATFIPPWNTLDGATLAALASTGFAAYSAALSEVQAAEPVVSVPHTAGLGDLRRLLPRLARRRGPALVVCMFHHFSFTDSTDPLARHVARLGLDELPALLAWCREQPGVVLGTVGQVAREQRQALADGRLAEAHERWHLVYQWRRTPVLGRALQHLFAPRAVIEPGGYERGSRWLRRLARLRGGAGEGRP